MTRLRLRKPWVLLILWIVPAAFPGVLIREIHGVVKDESGNPISRAVVLLKNTRSLRIRSYYSNSHGEYRFHGLSTRNDYEIRARYKGHTSSTHTLSRFDSNRDATVDLTIPLKR